MKRLLFLIFFLSAISYGQYKDVILKYNAADSTVLILPSFVVFNVPTLDTRLDSLIAALNAVESAADTRIDSILANSLPELDTRIDSLIAVVSADKDSTTSHNDRINALLDTAKVHQDTLGSHNDRILALLDSVNNHYSQAILNILLAAKFDKADTTDYYTDAMIDALLAYKFDKSDTSSYYKAVYLDALLSYYFLESDTTDYYKDVMVDALLGYKLNITDTSYQVQDSYLTALLPYYYVRTDTNSATLGFYPREMIDAKIAEITGSGVITLNGLSGVTQTLAIDTTIAGAPAWSSVGTTHTLQLPFLRFWKKSELDTASRWQPLGLPFDTTGRWPPAGTYLMPEDTSQHGDAATSGFIYYEDWNTFSDKVTEVTASSGLAVTGTTSPDIAPASGYVIPSTGDTTIWNAKLSASQVYPLTYAAKQAGSKISTNHLYITSDDSIGVSSTSIGGEAYEGEFNDLAVIDTIAISGANSYDSYTVSSFATAIDDTVTQTLHTYPFEDKVYVLRKYPQAGEGNKYTVHRIGGILAQATNFDATQSTATSIAFTLTKPATSTTATARPIDSVAIAYSKASGYSTLAEYGDSVKTIVVTSEADSLVDLEETTLYNIKPFSKTYCDETIAGTGDTCSTGASAGTPVIVCVDSCDVGWADASQIIQTAGYIRAGQSFTGTADNIDSVRFNIWKYGSPTGNAYVCLYAHSGTYGTSSVGTGDSLAVSGALDVSTLTTSVQPITFTFTGADRYLMEVGTYYVIVVYYAGGDASNYLRISSDATNNPHDGNCTRASWAGWASLSASDACFIVWGSHLE